MFDSISLMLFLVLEMILCMQNILVYLRNMFNNIPKVAFWKVKNILIIHLGLKNVEIDFIFFT